jgi:CcmD family protein
MTSELPYLFVVVCVTWIGIFMYLRKIGARQRRLQAQIDSLEAELTRQESTAVDVPPTQDSSDMICSI